MKPLDHAFFQTLKEGLDNLLGRDLHSRLRKLKNELIVKRRMPAAPKDAEEAEALYRKAIDDVKSVQSIEFWMSKGVHLLGQYIAILKLVRDNQTRFYGSARKYQTKFKELDAKLMALLSKKHSLDLVDRARNALKTKLRK